MSAVRRWINLILARLSSRVVALVALGTLPVLVLFTPGGWLSALAVLAGYVVALGGYWFAFARRRGRARPPGPDQGDYLTPLALPPAPPFLFGREHDLAALRAAQRAQPERAQPSERAERAEPRVLTIHGKAGVGKTALGLAFAHQVAEQYPDGQLFARLKGGATGAAPTGAVPTGAAADQLVHAVRDTFIRALSRALSRADQSSDDQAESARRYAELTNGRRILVVLDDVPSAEVARQLLPAGPDCLVVVTSRELLTGLGTSYDHTLQTLAQEPAMQTLRALLGSRIALDEGSAEAGAAHQIVHATSHQPLALQLAGGLLAERPQWSLRPVVRLLEAGSPGDARRERRPLDMAYLLLTEEEQRAVKLLGLFTDEPLAPWMLAALMEDIGEDGAGRIVDRLARAGMVERIDRDVAGVPEYRVLDYVQGYALERLTQDAAEKIPGLRKSLRTARERRAATGPSLAVLDDPLILLDSGRITAALTAARAAVAAARAGGDRAGGDRAAEGRALSVLAELQAEVGGVQAAGELARAATELAGDDLVTGARAARCVSRVLRVRQDFRGALAQADQALDLLEQARAAGRDDPVERIRALRHRATTLARLARADAAEYDLSEAEHLAAGLASPPVRAALGVARGEVRLCAGDYPGALDWLRRAEQEAIEDGQPRWRGWAVYDQARAEHALHNCDRALELARTSLDLFGEMTHRYGKAYARVEVAMIYRDRQDLDAASIALENALETFRSCGDRWIEAQTLCWLAGVWSAQNRQLDEVTVMLREAAQLFRAAGDQASADAAIRQRWLIRLHRLQILPIMVPLPHPR